MNINLKKLIFYISTLISFNKYINAQINEDLHKDVKEILNFQSKIESLRRRQTRFSFLSLFNDIINRYESHFSNSQQSNALLRCSNELCKEELDFVKLRKEKIKKNFEKLIGKELDINHIPTIAFGGSGGGYRAMTATFGALSGLQDIGLFDLCTYLSGVSGSTWIIAAIMANNSVDLSELENYIKNSIDKPIEHGLDIENLIEREFLNTYHGQKITSVTIWGEMLGDKFLNHLDKERYKYKLSDIKNVISNADIPMPIFNSAIAFESKDYSAIYHWMEYTPYEIGCRDNKMFVPTWAFGRKFKKGKSVNNLQEPSLEFLMGVWGSAFTATLNEIIKNFKNKIPNIIFNDIEKVVNHSTLGEIRLFPAELYNPAYKAKNNKWQKYKRITLVDAGLDCNLPLLPLVQREADIIIIFDSSADIIGAPELKKAEIQAKTRNLKFPKIDYENIDKKHISIFKDENDKNCPIIVYMPLIQDTSYSSDFNPVESIKNGFCNTLNLCYTQEDFDLLFGLTKYIVNKEKDTILNLIKDFINTKIELNKN